VKRQVFFREKALHKSPSPGKDAEDECRGKLAYRILGVIAARKSLAGREDRKPWREMNLASTPKKEQLGAKQRRRAREIRPSNKGLVEVLRNEDENGGAISVFFN